MYGCCNMGIHLISNDVIMIKSIILLGIFIGVIYSLTKPEKVTDTIPIFILAMFLTAYFSAIENNND